MAQLVIVDTVRLPTLVHRDLVGRPQRQDMYYAFNPSLAEPLLWDVAPLELAELTGPRTPRYLLAPWEHYRVFPGVMRKLNLSVSNSTRSHWVVARAVASSQGSALTVQAVLEDMLAQSGMTAPLQDWYLVDSNSMAGARQNLQHPRSLRLSPELILSRREAQWAYVFAALAQTYLQPHVAPFLEEGWPWSWFFIPALLALQLGSMSKQDFDALCRPWGGNLAHAERCAWLGADSSPESLVAQLRQAGFLTPQPGPLVLSRRGWEARTYLQVIGRNVDWPRQIARWRLEQDDGRLLDTMCTWFDQLAKKAPLKFS